MSKFGERLQNLRTRRNLAVKETCFAVGIPQSRLNELEWGVRIPTRGQVERLAQYFDVNAQELADLLEEGDQAA